MRAAWRPDDVRVAEERLMESVPDGELMRHAAAALARRCALVLSGMGRVYGSRVLVLVGAGNNGGDALFAGALLARRGASVVAMLTAPDRAHPGGLADFRAAGGMLTALLPELSHVDLIVDGIVGIGARGGLRGPAAHIASEVDRLRGAVPVVAVDVPSGVDVTTGAVCGPAIRADVTVTFGCLKPGLMVGPAATLAGEIEVVDIGLGPHLTAPPVLRVPATVDIARWWPRPGPNSDKYRRGVAGLSTGSGRFPGAAILSTAGALAGPAGLVRYAGPTGSAVVAAHPSVVVSSGVAEAGRAQAWLCGCGLGTDEGARTQLDAVLAHPGPVVLDADALTLLAADGVEQTLRRRPGPTVLTPHDGEFVRLVSGRGGVSGDDGDRPDPLGNDRVAAATALAERIGAVVLLKGDRTIVAVPGQPAWVNPTGTSALATAGTGDVLAGLLVSLLAAGVEADRAAICAAYLHGLAGRRAARGVAGAPVTAADVAACLPSVIVESLSAY